MVRRRVVMLTVGLLAAGTPLGAWAAAGGQDSGCTVDYQVVQQWQGGFIGEVTVSNASTAVNGWKVGFDFPSSQRILVSWSATHTQSGASVTLTNAPWNADLEAKATAKASFVATFGGSNPVPTAFTLNGATCNGFAPAPTPVPTSPTAQPTPTATPAPTATPTPTPTATSVPAPPPAPADGSVSVTVNATAGLGTVPSNAIGLNTAVYDANMNHSDMPGLLKEAGFTAMRYPGGSYSDIYNWKTHVADGGYVAGGTTFSEFMATAKAVGADPIITANYGTGTPELAAGWVEHANVTNNYGITWWEVGNETIGNGTYGANWEADGHCTDASGAPIPKGTYPNQTYNCGPSVYADNALKFISAMKAVDPDIHVCVTLTTPGFWPDGVTNAENPKPFNETVLTALGAKTDCVIIHYYPAGFPANPDLVALMNYPHQIAGIISGLKAQIQRFTGRNPADVPILVTEANSNVAVDVQPNALFAADMYLTWLENGVTNVDWWNQHNGPGTPSIINGVQDYGDGGIFSSGGNGSGVNEPPLNTPFAPYYGISMAAKLAVAGGTMVSSQSSDPLVRVHSVRRADGGLNVLLDNTDPKASHAVNLTYDGFTPSGAPTVRTFANNASTITSTTQGSAGSITVGPYSLTLLQIPGGGDPVVAVPGPPGPPEVSGLSSDTSGNTSGKATLSWAAGASGTYPVAKYEVYRVTAGGRTLISSQTATSLALRDLSIGQSYRYQVLSVDSHGNRSLPTSPVTVTVPPPTDASCAVHYDASNSWQDGFIANITLTNRAATPITDWKLTFTLPAEGQTAGNSWGASLSQSGRTVTATPTEGGSIAADGGTATLGFQGSYTSANPTPAAFFINGVACSNI